MVIRVDVQKLKLIINSKSWRSNMICRKNQLIRKSKVFKRSLTKFLIYKKMSCSYLTGVYLLSEGSLESAKKLTKILIINVSNSWSSIDLIFSNVDFDIILMIKFAILIIKIDLSSQTLICFWFSNPAL